MNIVPPPIPQEKNPLAVWSLVLGILSPFCCSVVTGVPAVICGHIAYSRSGRMLSKAGRGLAIAGLILGYLSFAMIPVQVALVLPAVAKARQRASETMCQVNLHIIADAKARYSAKHKDENPPDVETLVSDGELQALPRCPKKGVYRVGGPEEEPTCSVHGDLLKKPAGGARTQPVEKP